MTGWITECVTSSPPDSNPVTGNAVVHPHSAAEDSPRVDRIIKLPELQPDNHYGGIIMEVLSVIMGILLILLAIAIVCAVLLQSSKNARQSGVVSGSAEAFFGKSKGKAIDRKLNKITLALVIAFAVLVLAIYVLQPEKARPSYPDDYLDEAATATTTVATTTTAATTTTTAATTTTTAAEGGDQNPAE